LRTSRPLIIGLAGGVASGKSACARLLAGEDGLVLDADAATHEIQNDPRVLDAMERILGTPIRNASGALDRAAAARAAFSDPERKRRLEELLHPEVRRRIEATIDEASRAFPLTGRPALIVLDVPLLFEGGLAEKCDRIVFVESQESDRVARARATRGWDSNEIRRREAHQLDLASKRLRSQHVLVNTGSPEALAAAAAALRGELLSAPTNKA
jgi:dephospho-CoA kinase